MPEYLRHKSTHVHRLVAEEALGRPLPRGAEVHHINGDKHDNRPSNLVILNSRAEHSALHYRQKAFEQGGDADYVKCVYCKAWGPPETMYVRRRKKSGIEARHRDCHSAAERKRKEVP